MQCTSCNHIFDDLGKFCPECGTPTATSIKCRYCESSNPIGSKFCAECGKAPEETTQPTRTNQTNTVGASAKSTVTSSDLVYLLNEEQIRRGEPDRIQPPYGSVGVALINGTISRIFRQKPNSVITQGNTFKDLFTELKEGLLGAIGQKQQNVTTYILSDLSGLPVVNFKYLLNIPGTPNASLNFDFWIECREDEKDKELLGLFIQKYVAGKSGLTLNEFKKIAVQNIEQILSSFKGLSTLGKDQTSIPEIVNLLKKTTGISSRCVYNEGKKGQRVQYEISKLQKSVHCSECGEAHLEKVKFCGNCGNDMSDAAQWVNAVSYLQSSDGEQVSLRLSMVIDRSDKNVNIQIDESKVAEAVITQLGPKFRRTNLQSMMSASFLNSISQEINQQFISDWYGHVTDFVITDIKTAKEDWFFKTDALVAEELRKLEADKKFLVVDDEQLNLEEAAFAIALRRAQQIDSQELTLRRNSLETRIKEADLEIQEHQLETNIDLKKENIDSEADIQRSTMEREKILRDREKTKLHREDTIDEVDHDINLEKRAAKHDIDLADMTGEAESRSKRREISDEKFAEEEDIRLKIKLEKETKELGHIEEDLEDRRNTRQVDKLRAMAEMEANMAKQDNEQELAKAKQDNEAEIAKREAMKNLDASQMLAMQAAELAKAGGPGQAADIVKSIAESQAASAGAGIKDDMYKQMIEIQREASQSAIQAHKEAAAIAQSTNEKAMQSMTEVTKATAAHATDGYKEAAKIAQTTNEKSMESMSKVATAAAGKKSTGKEEQETSQQKYACISCNEVFDKPKKFCHKCGESQISE